MRKAKCQWCMRCDLHSIRGSNKYSHAHEYIRFLERSAQNALKAGEDVDIDHPIMVEYRRIIKEHWES